MQDIIFFSFISFMFFSLYLCMSLFSYDNNIVFNVPTNFNFILERRTKTLLRQAMDESEHGSRETITLVGILRRLIDCVNLYRGKIQFCTLSEISQSILLIELLRCVKECRFPVVPLCTFT